MKLYKDNHGKLKGDCAVAYEKRPSVDLAVQLLDGADFREGIPISVVEAVFDKTTRHRLLKRSAQATEVICFQTLRKVRKLQTQQKLSWNEVGVGDKVGLAVVVLRHMFSPDDIKRGASILDELRKDIFEECSVHGVVKTITL